MRFIRIITSTNLEALERKVNEFLAKEAEPITKLKYGEQVTDIKFCVSDDGFYAMLTF